MIVIKIMTQTPTIVPNEENKYLENDFIESTLKPSLEKIAINSIKALIKIAAMLVKVIVFAAL